MDKNFYEFTLGIADSDSFFNFFSNLGKLERVICLSRQSNKTKKKNFFDILWCQRYGINANRELRAIKPVACYSCKLKNSRVGATNKKDRLVKIVDIFHNVDLNTILIKDNAIQYNCV